MNQAQKNRRFFTAIAVGMTLCALVAIVQAVRFELDAERASASQAQLGKMDDYVSVLHELRDRYGMMGLVSALVAGGMWLVRWKQARPKPS